MFIFTFLLIIIIIFIIFYYKNYKKYSFFDDIENNYISNLISISLSEINNNLHSSLSIHDKQILLKYIDYNVLNYNTKNYYDLLLIKKHLKNFNKSKNILNEII